MDVTETVSTFTGFFRERRHRLIASSSLVPPPDDPVLFTSAGMHPLTRYLTGEPHPLGRRLAGSQRCLRTTDLEEVGDSCHLTVFQMLGSWSLGDYSQEQSLQWGLELLCDRFGIEPSRLHATAFGGDEHLGPDEPGWRTWQQLGIPVELLGPEDNWWSNGPTGPCGPDSEIFAWTGDGPPEGTPSGDSRWVELWNHVSMRYWRYSDGSLAPLAGLSIDTGMGLERLLMVSQQAPSVFDTDLFGSWLAELTRLWQPAERTLRISTDHLRSAIVVIGDGVRPSATGRGYVLRRLLRRALTALWRNDAGITLSDLPAELIRETGERFGMRIDRQQVGEILAGEEHKFRQLLRRGGALIGRLYPDGQLTEQDFEFLRDTHGLPPEIVSELVTQRDGRTGAAVSFSPGAARRAGDAGI